MHSPLNIFTWVLLFPLILSFPAVSSDPRATLAGNLTCSASLTELSISIPTFVLAMELLISTSLNNSNSSFGILNTTVFKSPFYALTQCHRDLSPTDCHVCYAASRTAIPGCLPRTSGRIFLDGCFVRYDNYSFFQEAVDPTTDAKNCSSSLFTSKYLSEYNQSVGELVENITQVAVSNGGFGVMELYGLYGLAQCWESLTNEECRVCLNKARTQAVGCLPSMEGRIMNAGCFLRYSTENFINNYSQGDRGKSRISLLPFFV
ncbi:putative non-specific serine/threonine protein kinase [Helianthus annuus]|nr:putative non-specific serine/threonine protein kinase [Helianthus annuus]